MLGRLFPFDRRTIINACVMFERTVCGQAEQQGLAIERWNHRLGKTRSTVVPQGAGATRGHQRVLHCLICIALRRSGRKGSLASVDGMHVVRRNSYLVSLLDRAERPCATVWHAVRLNTRRRSSSLWPPLIVCMW